MSEAVPAVKGEVGIEGPVTPLGGRGKNVLRGRIRDVKKDELVQAC